MIDSPKPIDRPVYDASMSMIVSNRVNIFFVKKIKLKNKFNNQQEWSRSMVREIMLLKIKKKL